jgi:hypothetical protein
LGAPLSFRNLEYLSPPIFLELDMNRYVFGLIIFAGILYHWPNVAFVQVIPTVALLAQDNFWLFCIKLFGFYTINK